MQTQKKLFCFLQFNKFYLKRLLAPFLCSFESDNICIVPHMTERERGREYVLKYVVSYLSHI